MKTLKYLFLLVVTLSLNGCNSNKLTTIEYLADYKDLGTCIEGDSLSFYLPYRNTGKHTLKIWKVTGNCGCTIPQLPKFPLEPNKTDSIKVTYYSKSQFGKNTNTVVVFANTTTEITQTFFKVEVKKKVD